MSEKFVNTDIIFTPRKLFTMNILKKMIRSFLSIFRKTKKKGSTIKRRREKKEIRRIYSTNRKNSLRIAEIGR